MSWFPPPTGRAPGALTLFCLPFAGGSAGAFHSWRGRLPDDVELVPARLPGREQRLADDPDFGIGELTAAVRDRAGDRFAFYGHSMGGRIAFEVVRELRRTGGPMPELLAVGGTRAPDVQENFGVLDGVSRLPTEQMWAALSAGGGIPAALLAHQELLTLLEPMIRADFRRLDDYVYTDEAPLPVPVLAFHGADDRLVPWEHVAGWSRHTSAGCELRTARGGHFFVREEHNADVLDPLGERLSRLRA